MTKGIEVSAWPACPRYSYRLRDLETDAELPLAVCHQDLVPADNTQ